MKRLRDHPSRQQYWRFQRWDSLVRNRKGEFESEFALENSDLTHDLIEIRVEDDDLYTQKASHKSFVWPLMQINKINHLDSRLDMPFKLSLEPIESCLWYWLIILIKVDRINLLNPQTLSHDESLINWRRVLVNLHAQDGWPRQSRISSNEIPLDFSLQVGNTKSWITGSNLGTKHRSDHNQLAYLLAASVAACVVRGGTRWSGCDSRGWGW